MSDQNYRQSAGSFHPFLQTMIDGKEGTTIKALQHLAQVLHTLHGAFLSNGKTLVALVEATDAMNERAQTATSRSDEVIKTLELRLSDIEQIAKAVHSSLGAISGAIEENGADLKNLKRLLSDFPSLLSQLKKMLTALDSRLAKPLEVRVELPAQEGAER